MNPNTKNIFSIIIISGFLISAFPAKGANAISQQELREQAIEILQREIQAIQLLIKNIQAGRSSSYAINATSYMAVDLADDTTLLQKNAAQALPIASVTKLMNAVVARENLDKNRQITLTEQMLDPLGQSPALYAGLTISVQNLLKASLIQSSNDAAQALSYALGEDQFLARMNQKANELGMANTFFADAHGLSLTNASTANDLAKLMAYIHRQHPETLQTTKSNDFWLADDKGKKLKFFNVNNFYYLPEFIGGKSGYLTKAGQTMAAVFNVKGKTIAIVVLNSNNRQADIFAILKALESM